MVRRTAGLVFILLAATAASGQEWLPPELRNLLPGDPEAFSQAIESKLESMLGKPFPDWELANGRGKHSLLSISPGPLVILYAGGPCPASLAELNRLSGADLDLPTGVLVTVFKNKGAYRERVVRRATKGWPHVYYIASWDDDGLMNYIRVYPTYLVLNSDHVLTAFQVRDRRRFEMSGAETSK